jgi:hypothetical protein
VTNTDVKEDDEEQLILFPVGYIITYRLYQIFSATHKSPKATATQAAYRVLSAKEIFSTSHQYSSHEQGQQDGSLLSK